MEEFSLDQSRVEPLRGKPQNPRKRRRCSPLNPFRALKSTQTRRALFNVLQLIIGEKPRNAGDDLTWTDRVQAFERLVVPAGILHARRTGKRMLQRAPNLTVWSGAPRDRKSVV